jgi:hypothetical protein
VTIERPEREYVRTGLPEDEWTGALAFVRRSTPRDAHLLVDPGHAWKFGTSARIGAVRDVYLEEVKDVAMALYSRETARRVRERIEAASPFESLDRARLVDLRDRFDLDYLLCTNEQAEALALTPVWRNTRFSVVPLAGVSALAHAPGW